MDEAKKIIVITGAILDGIGIAITELLIEKGFFVIGTFEPSEKDKAFELSKSKKNLKLYEVDYTNKKSLDNFLEKIDTPICGFINAHFYFEMENPLKFDHKIWENSVNVNLIMPNYLINKLKHLILPNSSIVIISSTEGFTGSFGSSAYSATKAGIHNLVKSLANILGKKAIRINAVAAGWIGGVMDTDEVFNLSKKMTPLQRLGNPKEIAKTCEFLISENSSFINGSVISVDGGYSGTDTISKFEFDKEFKSLLPEDSFWQHKIFYDKPLLDFIETVLRKYDLGVLVDFISLDLGHEDLTLMITTTKDKFYMKIFPKDTSIENKKYIAEIFKLTSENNIASPSPLKNQKGEQIFSVETNGKCDLGIIIKMAAGAPLHKKENFVLTDEIIRIITKEAAKINSLQNMPDTKKYDYWGCIEFKEEYEKYRKILNNDERGILDKVLRVYEKIDFKKLPKCFIQADLTESHILIDDNNNINIIDYSSAFIGPRIQELSVLFSQTFYSSNKAQYLKNYNTMLEEYQKYIKLTDCELKTLPDYITIAFGINYLGAIRTRLTTDDKSEYIKGFEVRCKEALSKI